MVNYTRYRDVKLKLTPKQWGDFVTPTGIGVIWDHYNFHDHSVVGRFYVSDAHLNPDERKTIEQLDRFIESMGRYVITTNSTHNKFNEVKDISLQFGQFTNTWMDHPYTKDLPKDIDLHIPENHNTGIISKSELDAVNYSIKHEADRFPQLKKYRDDRFKPKEKKGGYEVYVGVLESIN